MGRGGEGACALPRVLEVHHLADVDARIPRRVPQLLHHRLVERGAVGHGHCLPLRGVQHRQVRELLVGVDLGRARANDIGGPPDG
eukprot:8284439-Pyramimonas_sp.AAC.1